MGQARTWPRQATSSCGASTAPQRGAASKGRNLPPGERREGRRARLRAACAGGISVVCGCGRCGRVAWRAGLRVGVWGGGRTPLPMPRGRESAPSGSQGRRVSAAGSQPAEPGWIQSGAAVDEAGAASSSRPHARSGRLERPNLGGAGRREAASSPTVLENMCAPDRLHRHHPHLCRGLGAEPPQQPTCAKLCELGGLAGEAIQGVAST